MKIMLTALSGALLVCSTTMAESPPAGYRAAGAVRIADKPVEQAAATMYSPGHVTLSSPSEEFPQYPAFEPNTVTLEELQGNQPSYAPTIGYQMLDPFGPLYRLDKRSGESFGYDEGYTNLVMFIPKHLDPNRSLIFTDLRALITDQGKGGASVGLGYRYYSCDLDRLFTFAGWWDLDDGHNETYNQAGFSFESLGKFFDARVNGYLPLGQDSFELSNRVVGGFFFSGYNILLNRQITVESAYRGIDAEIGGPLPLLGRYGITAHVGAYWFESKDDEDAAGVSTRVGANVTEDLMIRVGVTDDDVFKTNLTVDVIYTLPDGLPSRWFRPRPVQERLSDQVERRYRVTTHTQVFSGQELAINPADDMPFVVAHINPNLTSPGNGTFENPFNRLAEFDGLPFPEKSEFDIVAVQRRNDDTSMNLSSGVTLLDDQRLLSESVLHTVTSTVGTFPLPGFFSPGPNPRLSNPLGDVVTLSNNNEVSGFTIEDSPGFGIMGSDIVDFDINRNILQNNLDQVVLTNASGTGAFVSNTLIGDGITTNRGFELMNTGSGPLDLTVTFNDAQGHLGAGFNISADASDIALAMGTGVDADADGVGDDGNVSTGNSDGLILNAATGGTITGTVIANDFSSNTNNGVAMTADTGGAITLASFDMNLVSDNGAENMVMNAIDGGMISMPITNSTFDNAGATGILVTADGGDVFWSAFDDNSVTGNAGDGLGIITMNGGTFTALTMANISFDDNVAAGINVDADSGAVDLGLLTMPSFDRTMAGTTGILVNSIDADIALAVEEGQFIGDPDPTTGNPDSAFGIRTNVENGSLDLSVVDSVFDNNVDAAIAVLLEGDAKGTLNIVNNTITRTTDGADTDFNGVGIGIILRDTAVLDPPLIDGNTIGSMDDDTMANASHGISVFQQEDSVVDGLTISNNLIANNLGNGIDWVRRDDAIIDSVSILDNIITANSGTMDPDTSDPEGVDDRAGLRILAQNGALDTLDFTIEGNEITNNTLRGVFFRTEADVFLRVDMTDNLIDGNVLHGIESRGRENDPLGTDEQNIGGTWVQNTITNNGGHGFLSGSVMGTGANTFDIGLDGMDAEGRSLANLIADNGLDGIEINSNGSVSITNNDILRNGGMAVGDATQGGGIDINNNFLSFTEVGLYNNRIMENEGDGLEILTREVFSGPLAVTRIKALGNQIEFNTGRGVDILNAGNADANIRFGDGTDAGMNDISSNGLEGFYVVQTASTNQNQSDDASVDLLADGDVREIPNMDVDVNHNLIRGNGELSLTFPGTGYVLRVGSVNGTFDFTGTPVGTPSGDNTFANGRVNARVLDNTFEGNFGVDAFIESFTSTVPPVTTTGTWDAMMFVIMSPFQSDPVARLNMVFRGNVGDSADVTRGEDDRRPGIDNVTGAFYSNAEGTFKSRLGTATPGGPFGTPPGGGRRRNAQRITSNDPPYSSPGTPGDAALFEYPGVGPSAFRVESDFQDPLNDPASWPGGGTSFLELRPFSPNTFFGEEPFGWDTTVAPGTFTFPDPIP